MKLNDEVSPHIIPGNDFFHYVNQRWLDEHPIPADKARVGVFESLMDENIEKLRALLDEPAAADEHANIGLLRQYYAAAMNETAIAEATEAKVEGIKSAVARLSSAADVTGYLASYHAKGLSLGWNPYIEPDDKDSSRYVLRFSQSGLGLPDRDYYLESAERFVTIKGKYSEFLSNLFGLVGLDRTTERAEGVVALETKLAESWMDAVERRDPDKQYNPFQPSQLSERYPSVDWARYFDSIGFDGVKQTIISQPGFMETVLQLLQSEKLEVWQDYLLAHSLLPLMTKLAPAYEDLHFGFYGKVLRGTTELEPRWRRMIKGCIVMLPEPAGQLFVANYFEPTAKQEITDMVDRLQVALGKRIDGLEWMSEATKEKAHDKLGTFLPLLGYPDSWREYKTLHLDDSFVDNFEATVLEEWQRTIKRLDGPVDRREWLMSPALVNAYYWPNTNGITFPAAILQPPFFDVHGDFASNYGAIGAVIGHEIIHGFDDEGSKFDAAGNLKSWWTPEDRAAFEARAEKLVEQFDQYEIHGQKVNGKLTLGENIADLGGLLVAYDALQTKMADGAPVDEVNGFSPAQRFFIGFARSWRENIRPEFSLQLLVSDPHAPDLYRVNGIVCNIDPFYEAFTVESEHVLYLKPEERVRIW